MNQKIATQKWQISLASSSWQNAKIVRKLGSTKKVFRWVIFVNFISQYIHPVGCGGLLSFLSCSMVINFTGEEQELPFNVSRENGKKKTRGESTRVESERGKQRPKTKWSSSPDEVLMYARALSLAEKRESGVNN